MTFAFNRAPFPATRLRRMRRHDALRQMLSETLLQPQHLIAPVFVLPGTQQRQAIASMPGIERLSVDLLLKHAETLLALGVKDIRTGPTAPAFLTPALLKVLEEQFGLKGTTTADADLAEILAA